MVFVYSKVNKSDSKRSELYRLNRLTDCLYWVAGMGYIVKTSFVQHRNYHVTTEKVLTTGAWPDSADHLVLRIC